MVRFEFFSLVLSIALVIACFFLDRTQHALIVIPAVFLALLIIQIWTAPFRWQLLPVWCALILSQAVFFLNIAPRSPGWLALLMVCSLLISTSFVLVIGMPLLRLPKPDGPHGVGSITHTLVDQDRTSHETSTTYGRKLFVKVWYPTDRDYESISKKTENLWEELYRSEDVPQSLQWLTAYLGGVRTHTISNAPCATTVKNPRLIMYNHGMVSIASENTILMEHLASHGFVVFGIRHLDQLTEFQTLNGQTAESDHDKNQAIMKRLATRIDRPTRAELSLKYYHSSSATNRIVNARALDTRFVLDHTSTLMAQIPSSHDVKLSADEIGLLGLSLGGAVATEFDKIDQRCVAVANLDGGLFGIHLDKPIRAPYLMMYSEQNEGSNDLLLQNHGDNVCEVVLPQTKHMDYHDATLVLPILRWVGALGRARPLHTVHAKNEETRKFFEMFLNAGVTAD